MKISMLRPIFPSGNSAFQVNAGVFARVLCAGAFAVGLIGAAQAQVSGKPGAGSDLVPSSLVASEAALSFAQPDATLSAADTALLADLRRNSAPQPALAQRAPLATYTCNGAGGLWSAAGTWTPSGPPTAADDVTISAGCTVTVDTAAAALSLNVAGTGVLDFDATTARSLTVSGSVSIDAGGSLNTPASGTITTHVLSVGGNLTNNGILDLSTNANTAGAGLVFTNTGSNSFSGSGATTDLRTLTINKGTSSANVLELSTANFSVQGTTTDGTPMAFLTLTNGTLKISGAFTLAGRIFAVAAYSIPATGGFWLNNANVTVSGQGASPTNNGLFRLSNGIFNVGTSSGNSLGAGTAAFFVIEGGTLNVAGRINSTSTFITYTQSGGSVNVCTVGNAATTPSFGFTSATGTLMNFSGGTINLVQASTNAAPLDYSQGGTMNFTGGTLNVGTAATLTNFVFRIQGQMPNVVIDNSTNNKFANLSAQGNVWGNLTINTGTTLNLNPVATAQTLLMIGQTVTNNGAIITNTNNTGTVNFAGGLQTVGSAYTQTYTGSGTFGAAALRIGSFSVQNPLGITLGAAVSSLNIYRINAFFGLITNADKLANGNGDATALVIQRGVSGAFPAGSLNVAPTANIGTGGLILVYSQSSTPVITGPEIPASRSILSLTVVNATGVTLAGGPLTLGATGALTLSSGTLTTSAANLLTLTNPATTAIGAVSGTSFVSGPLARTLPASLVTGSTFTFPLGKNSFKMLELVNPTTNAGGTVVVQAEVFDVNSGGTAGASLGGLNSNRYWAAQITSGAANFTDASVRLTEAATPGVSAIAQSATQTGAYDSVGGTVTPPVIGPSSTVTQLGFFAVGALSGGTPICGNFNVGAAGDFATLTAAVNALNTRLMTCAVSFTLLDNVYAAETYPIQINANAGASAVNTLTIKPAVGITPAFTGSAATALILLNGADYITIDGSNSVGGTSRDLSFVNSNVSVTSAVIWGQTVGFNDPASNNTLRNLVVTGNADITTLVGIGFGSNVIGAASLGTRNNNNRVQNNRVSSTQFGIYSQGASTNIKNIGTVITGNELGGSGTSALGRVGIYVGFDDGVQITNNFVNGISGLSASVDAIGIAVGSNSISNTAFTTNNDVANVVITGNVVGQVIKTDTFSAAGISLATNLYGTSRIANNFVHNIRGNGTSGDFCVGILIGNAGSNTATTEVYYNSVSITGNRDDVVGGVTTQPAFALAILGANPLVDLRNNALVNTSIAPTNGGPGLGAGSYAIGLSSVMPLNKLTSNYNDFFSSGAASHFAMVGSLVSNVADQVNLVAWQAATGKDANSISADPLYTSATDLHIPALSPANNAGTPITGLTLDIDGNTRSLTTPEIGADEFVPPNTAPSITPAVGVTRQQGTGVSNSTIATVSDAEQAAGTLVVTVPTVPAGLTVSSIVNSTGTVTANLVAACSATVGANTVGLSVSDGLLSTAGNLSVNVTANSAPTLGSYGATSLFTGNGTTVTPNTAPTDNGSVASVSAAAPGFTGTFSGNAATGVITISNAGPASGSPYTVTVTSTDNCGLASTTTFTLTVQNFNNPPTLTPTPGGITRQAGSVGTNSQIASVLDPESPPSSLLVTAPIVPAGLSVTNITNSVMRTPAGDPASHVRADVAANCMATVGANTVGLNVADGALNVTANLSVNVTANGAPTLGSYGATVVSTGSGTTVTPNAAPTDNGSVATLTAAAPGFAGTFSGNASTGVITISGASPASATAYVVTVTATDNCGLTTASTFNLTVNTSPTYTPAAALTRQQGSSSNSGLGTVSDPEQTAASLVVSPYFVPAGLTLSGLLNTNGAVTGTVAAACTATLGNNSLALQVSDGIVSSFNNITVNVTANTVPVLGTYGATTATTGGTNTATPSAAPSDNGSVVSVTAAAPGFTGTLTGNPTTGVITITNAGPAGSYVVTVTATDNCGSTSTRTFNLDVSNGNSAPTITPAVGLTRQQGSTASSSAIATVSDAESSAGSLTVSAPSVPAGLSVNGIINTSGSVAASIAAACTATVGNNTVGLSVSDGSLSTSGSLVVAVTANSAPVLGTYGATSVATAGAATVIPTAAPTDNGSVATLTASAPGFAGTFTGNPSTGVISISAAAPASTTAYVVTVVATDNCGFTSTRTFNLTVSNTANLDVSKADGVSTYRAGDLLVYTLVLRNLGPDSANGAVFTDTVPAALINATWTCVAASGAACPQTSGSGSINATVAVLPSSGRLTYTLQANVATPIPAQVSNTAQVSITGLAVTDPQLANNSATDIDLPEAIFSNGFEDPIAPLIDKANGQQSIALGNFSELLDDTARILFSANDANGEALRVYGRRNAAGEVELALALRDADGLLRLGPWQRFTGNVASVGYVARAGADGFVLQSARFE